MEVRKKMQDKLLMMYMRLILIEMCDKWELTVVDSGGRNPATTCRILVFEQLRIGCMPYESSRRSEKLSLYTD